MRNLTYRIADVGNWIATHNLELALCVSDGYIDWNIYSRKLERVATEFDRISRDALDNGRFDRTKPSEVRQSIGYAEGVIDELKRKCGLM